METKMYYPPDPGYYELSEAFQAWILVGMILVALVTVVILGLITAGISNVIITVYENRRDTKMIKAKLEKCETSKLKHKKNKHKKKFEKGK